MLRESKARYVLPSRAPGGPDADARPFSRRQLPGPGIILSFAIAAAACACAAFCYAELAAMIPKAGGAYTYGYATLGELPAWIIGWDLVLEYMVGACLVAIGWSAYFTNFTNNLLRPLGLALPHSLTAAPWGPEPGVMNLPAVLIVLLLTALLVRGIRESARVNLAIVLIKVAVIVLFIFLAVGHVNPANWRPFAPFGFSGIVTAAAIVFLAYVGFDAVSTTAEEAKNPQKDMPVGILGSLGVATLLYMAVAAIMTGVVPYQKLNVADPVALVLNELGMPWASAVIPVAGGRPRSTRPSAALAPPSTLGGSRAQPTARPRAYAPQTPTLREAKPRSARPTRAPAKLDARSVCPPPKPTSVGALAGIASVLLVLLLGQPRILFAMSRDGLLPQIFSRVHPRFRTPHLTTAATGLVVAVGAGFTPIGVVAELCSIGTLSAFAIVSGGVLVLRQTRPHVPRPFRASLYPVVPALGVVLCLYLMASLPLITWLRFLLWLLLGLAIYASFGFKRSLVNSSAASS
jgi:APA family basic amino acid/polyamine antiporter